MNLSSVSKAAFTNAIAARLRLRPDISEEAAAKIAPIVLSEWLESHNLTYGQAPFCFTLACANSVADLYIADRDSEAA